MSLTYVKEIDRYLTPQQLQMWNGEYFHKNLCDYYRELWRSEYQHSLFARGLIDKRPEALKVATMSLEINPPPPYVRETKFDPPRPNRCQELDKRLEFRTGCGGWLCAHRCNLLVILQPVVPGQTCQTCESYRDSGERF